MHAMVTKAVCWSALALAATTLIAAEGEMRKAEVIGIPIKAVVYGNSHGVLAKSPRGQPGMFYIPYYSMTGSALVGCHPATKELVTAKLGSSGGYGCCVGSDGALYVGGVEPKGACILKPIFIA